MVFEDLIDQYWEVDPYSLMFIFNVNYAEHLDSNTPNLSEMLLDLFDISLPEIAIFYVNPGEHYISFYG